MTQKDARHDPPRRSHRPKTSVLMRTPVVTMAPGELLARICGSRKRTRARTLPMLRCTEVSQQTDEMGQKRYFRAEPHVRLRQERTSRPDSGWCRTGRLHG